MTIEKIFIIWQCVYLTISMCGWAELTDRQLFFPSACAVVAIIIRAYILFKKKQELHELRMNMKEDLEEIERVMGKQDEEDN